MCTQFGSTLQKDMEVSRSQVLYMLASMYSGRQKSFVPGISLHGLRGIIGHVSVFSMSLLRNVDTPEQVCRFIIADLPVVDLASENDGELFAATGTSIEFDQQPVKPMDIIPHGPNKKWSLHAKMGVIFDGGESGVVMAARCSGRLVGWFSPLAADVMFLSSAYLRNVVDIETTEDFRVTGFEICDEDWQNVRVPRPIEENSDNAFWCRALVWLPGLEICCNGLFQRCGRRSRYLDGKL
jgi:hypothetical protein